MDNTYIHTVPITTEIRSWGGADSTRIDHYVLRGTTEQVVKHVADVLTRCLNDGRTTRLELTPVASYSVIDLAKRGEA